MGSFQNLLRRHIFTEEFFLNPLSTGACAPAPQLYDSHVHGKLKQKERGCNRGRLPEELRSMFVAGGKKTLQSLHGPTGAAGSAGQIPALRVFHPPFIKMAFLVALKRANGMGGSAVPDGVVGGAPGIVQTGCLRGALWAALCVVGAFEQEAVPIYFGSGGIDGGKYASGSVWDVLELLCPPHRQDANAEVRAKFCPCFLLSCSEEAAALWLKPLPELPLDERLATAPYARAACWRLPGQSPNHATMCCPYENPLLSSSQRFWAVMSICL